MMRTAPSVLNSANQFLAHDRRATLEAKHDHVFRSVQLTHLRKLTLTAKDFEQLKAEKPIEDNQPQQNRQTRTLVGPAQSWGVRQLTDAVKQE